MFNNTRWQWWHLYSSAVLQNIQKLKTLLFTVNDPLLSQEPTLLLVVPSAYCQTFNVSTSNDIYNYKSDSLIYCPSKIMSIVPNNNNASKAFRTLPEYIVEYLTYLFGYFQGFFRVWHQGLVHKMCQIGLPI